MHRSRLVAAIAVVVLLAGCGGDERAPARSISDAVELWFMRGDGQLRCAQAMTERFAREVYGGVDACRRVHSPADETRGFAAAVHLGAVRRSGDRATVAVELVGGDAAGATGRVRLAQGDGGWRIDELGTDLLRAVFSRFLFGQARLTADRPGLRVGRTRDCVFREVRRRPEREFRREAYAAFAGDRASASLVTDVILGCLNEPGSGPDGLSYLRAQLIKDSLDGLEQGRIDGARRGAAARSCVRTALTERLTDADVRAHVERDRSAPPAATEKVARLLASCLR